MRKNRLTKEDQLQKRVDRDFGRISERWPLFRHRQCVRCRDMIRREWIWAVLHNEPGADNFYCTTCFPTREEVYQAALAHWVPRHKKRIGGFPKEETNTPY